MTPPAIDPEHFRRMGHALVDLVTDHFAGIRERPVFRPMQPAERATLMQEALGEAGARPEVIIERFRTAVLPHAMGNGHPRFFGWVNSPPAPIGVLADFLAAAMNPSCAGGDHAAIYVERAAVRWLMELIGFPTEGSMGLLVSGGSVATLTGLAAARHWAAAQDGWSVRNEGLQHGRRPFVLYTSEQGHSCIEKTAELLGLGTDAIHAVPVDEQFRMRVPDLASAIAAHRAAGKRPFCVAASAGTVGTGAIDPLAELAGLCGAERLWLHVDGAYGAVAAVGAGLERADSVALDPHKWLSVPVECGAVLVRDGELLRQAFSLVPAYLRTEPDRGFGGLPWFSEYGVQQTRGFRALKLWMTLQHLAQRCARPRRASHGPRRASGPPGGRVPRPRAARPGRALRRLLPLRAGPAARRRRAAQCTQQASDGDGAGLRRGVLDPDNAAWALHPARVRAALCDDGGRRGGSGGRGAADRREALG